jgi:serine/threonine protein kinase
MQLLGKSLEYYFEKRKSFSLKTVCMLGFQMVSILEYIHNKHILHRDIKPDNFVMGANENNAHLYILDFGLAKKYRSSKTLKQYPLIKKKKLTGTARYASIHALEELEQSRRDDLESVGYVLLYFLRGSLPWQGLKIKSKEDRYKKILDKKKETSSENLCKGFPEEFKEFVEYTRNLDYYEQPDYEMLRNKFFNLITKKLGETFDYIYDWTTESDIKKRKIEGLDLAPSTNYPVSEKKSTQKEIESINSNKKKLNPVHIPVNKTINSENIDVNNNIIIDEAKEDINIGYQSKCCTIF